MANYYMVGGDGKEYGPVSAEQLRQWVVEGRANAQTLVRSTDGGPQLPLGTVPELSSSPSSPASASSPMSLGSPSSASASSYSSGASEYYMRGGDGKDYGPVSAAQIRQWVAEGRANAQTLVRAANGGPYMAISMVPELSTAAAPSHTPSYNTPLAQSLAQNSSLGSTDSSQLVKRMAEILASSASWMKFLSVLMFLQAAGMILGTWGIGLIVAWIPIWCGIVLWGAASSIQQAVYTGREADLIRALDQYRFYFKLSGILRIVMFVLGVVILILSFGFIMAAAAAAGHQQF